MASAGLLFLMLMSSSFLISTVSIPASANQNQLQENSSKKLDKAKTIVMKTLAVIEKIAQAVSPFMEVIPVHGSLIAAVVTLIGVGASGVNQMMNGDSLEALMNEFENLNLKIDQYHVEQKWETWASNTYHKPEMNINTAWSKFTTMLHSVRAAKDDNEKVKYEKEFEESYYLKYEPATKKLQIMLNTKGTTFISPLGDLLAEHVKCHEKDVLKYTVLIHKLIYKGNLMNQFYYQLKGTKSPSKVNDAAQIAYDAASVMFQVHMKCIVSSMEYIKKDVVTLIDKTKTRSELAKEVWSFLVKEYDRYDWMVVAFKTKNSQKWIKSLNSHVLSGFTEVKKQGISVAVARQVKGNHTKTALVKQTIGRCIDKSVKCHDVANKLKECTETMKGIRVSKTYTAVHAYLREAHDSHNAQENPDEEYEVSADPEDSSSQRPFIYKGECKKHLGPMSGKFVVLIRSDQEIMTENPCSNLNCGGEERGECVRVKDLFLAMCQCKQPYYGEHCEESLDDYKRDLEAEIQVEESAVASLE